MNTELTALEMQILKNINSRYQKTSNKNNFNFIKILAKIDRLQYKRFYLSFL